MPEVRAHIVVIGYVQGVFFRHSMSQVARKAGVTGWVRNLADGRVEAVVEGDQANVQAVVDWCHEGPPHATVERVEFSWEPPRQEFSGFSAI